MPSVRAAIQQGQVHGRAPAVAGDRGDVFAEQRLFVEIGIVARLGLLVLQVAGPAHEMRHRTRRPVAVEQLQAESFLAQRRFHALQGLGRRFAQETAGSQVAVDANSDEIIGAGIADVFGDIRDQRADVHQAGLGECGRIGDYRCGCGDCGRTCRDHQNRRQHQGMTVS